jgi:Domain of Unknown Function (DUF928)
MPQYHRAHRTAITLCAISAGLGLGLAAAAPAMAQGISWGDVIKWLAPQRRSGATRDGNPCILSMDSEPLTANQSASRTPTLIWKGSAKKVGLQRSGDDRDFWQSELKFKSPGIQQVRYNGPALESDETYTWVVYGLLGQTKADFTVMSDADQTMLTTELANQTDLTARLAIYEAKQLRSDAWSEIIKPRNQTAELRSAIAAAPAQICPKPPAAAALSRP